MSATATAIRNRTDAINTQLADHVNTVRAHDAVHPDRDECGGVGGCVLLRTEVDTRRDLTDALTRAARDGLSVTVNVHDAIANT